MKKIAKNLMLVLIGLISVVPFMTVKANEDPANIYIFYGEGCGYCAGAMTFFEGLSDEYQSMFNLTKLEVWSDEDNSALLQEVADVFGDEVGGVPYIVIGEKTFAGYDLSGGYDDDIKAAIEELYNAEVRFDVMDNLGVKLDKNKNTSSDVLVYVILVIILGGAVALLFIARNNTEEVIEPEVKKEEVVEETKKVEAKEVKKETKPVAKKTTTAKKITSKKSTPSKKKTTKKASTK